MIAIVEGVGSNLCSLTNALDRLEVHWELTRDPATIFAAQGVILPGVGHARAGMSQLKQSGLIATLGNVTKPLLGICLGMQLLFEWSDEDQTECLGLIPGRVARIPHSKECPVPHMGWNQVNVVESREVSESAGLLQRFEKAASFYFVHSYRVESPYVVADCEYSGRTGAVTQYGQFYGCQFHPEKSGEAGQTILRTFIGDICGENLSGY